MTKNSKSCHVDISRRSMDAGRISRDADWIGDAYAALG